MLSQQLVHAAALTRDLRDIKIPLLLVGRVWV
jgi:hypothetical protein